MDSLSADAQDLHDENTQTLDYFDAETFLSKYPQMAYAFHWPFRTDHAVWDNTQRCLRQADAIERGETQLEALPSQRTFDIERQQLEHEREHDARGDLDYTDDYSDLDNDPEDSDLRGSRLDATTASAPSAEASAQKTPTGPGFIEPVEQDALAKAEGVHVDTARAQKHLIRTEGLACLVQHTLRKELALPAAMGDDGPPVLLGIGYLIAFNTHSDVIDTAISGSWRRGYLGSKSLAGALDMLRAHGEGANYPHIYISELSDHIGNAPSPNELLLILSITEDYYHLRGPAMAKRIDSFREPHTPSAHIPTPNYRKYLWHEKSDGLRKDRVACGLEFCAALRQRIATTSADEIETPLKVPLVKVGCTQNISSRLRDDLAHRSSNTIMNIIEAICEVLWPGRFHIWQYVIHSCGAANRVAAAKIFFSNLCESYVSNAGGFSTKPTAQSVRTSYAGGHADWEEATRWAAKHMLSEENRREEKALVKARRQRNERNRERKRNRVLNTQPLTPEDIQRRERISLLKKEAAEHGGRTSTIPYDEELAEIVKNVGSRAWDEIPDDTKTPLAVAMWSVLVKDLEDVQ